MSDFLLIKARDLGKEKCEDIVKYIDVNSNDVVVSEAGLRALAAWYRKQSSRLANLAKTRGYAENLLKISIVFCGPSRQQSPFNAQARLQEKKGRVDFDTFAQSIEMVLDLVSDTDLAPTVLKDLSTDLFSEFVIRLGNYVPRDITFSTQEASMDVLVRISAQYYGQKKKYAKERFKIIINSMPDPFSKTIGDPDLGCKAALEHMRPLLSATNQNNKNIASASFRSLSYEDQPMIQMDGYIDVCQSSVILTLTAEVQGVDRLELRFGDLSKIHFIDDEMGNDNSKSIDFSLDVVPDQLKTILGLNFSQDLSQGVFNITLAKEADLDRLQWTAQRGLAMESSLRDDEMEEEVKELAATDTRKTSMVTSRSSSREASLVTPSAASAKAMAKGLRAKQLQQRSAAANLDRPGSYTVSSEEAGGEGEDEDEEKDKEGSPAGSRKAAPKPTSPPSRRSARLHHMDGTKTKDGEEDMDAYHDKEQEQDLSKVAKTVEAPNVRVKPSRSTSVTNPSTTAASSPARMRRAVTATSPPTKAGEQALPSFSQADKAMQQEQGVAGAAQEKRKATHSPAPKVQNAKKARVAPAKGLKHAGLDKENALAEGRKRAREAESKSGGLRARNVGMATATVAPTRALSYKQGDGRTRKLEDNIFQQQTSSQFLFSSSEESEGEEEGSGDHYVPTGRGEEGRRKKLQQPSQRRVRQRREEFVDIDEGQPDRYSSEDTTGGGKESRGGAEDDLDSTIQNLIAEISSNQVKRTQARNERIFVAQADAAVNQIKAYLREWIAHRRGQLDKVEREAANDIRLAMKVAEVQKNSLSVDVVYATRRVEELEDDMRPLETAAQALFRDVQAFKQQCVSDNSKFKAECQMRFDDLQRSVKKGITEDSKSVITMQRTFRGELSRA